MKIKSHKKSRLIIVEPFGGLANRMRVIASGIWLKNQIKGNLDVIWKETEEINCPFELIFEENREFRTIAKKQFSNRLLPTNQPDSIKRIKANLINRLCGVNYCVFEHDFANLIWPGKLNLIEVASKNKTVYFRTCQEFGENLPIFKQFNPRNEIRERIEMASKNFTKFTIGIHIRRTDNDASIKNSPLELFIEKMRRELSQESKTSFFLSTDDPELEITFFNLFGDKIITYKKELSRQTVRGIQDAVVDLYCLSRTKKIIGSYWSSFSEIASRISQTSLEIVKK